MGYIYLVTNKVNGKQYIGQSVCKDIKNRWKQHKAKDSKTIGNYLLSAYNKYGIDNFTYKVICICFDEDCNRFEEEYIKKYNTLAPNGYNLQSGRKRIYIKKENKNILKGEYHPSFGKKYSEEDKKMMSERVKGFKNPNYGKKMSEQQKQKISKTMSGKKRVPMKNEIKNICIKNLIANTLNKKKVAKYDLNNNLIEIYSSITEASIKNNIQRMIISKICNNKTGYKSSNGYTFKFTS